MLLTTLLCFSSQAFADGQLKLSHAVTHAEQIGDYQTISLTLTVDNLTSTDLHRVKLSPTSTEISSNEQDRLVNIGYLPSMGQAIIEWTVKTPVSIEYFQSGMPVFFIIKAKQESGDEIEIPIYSSGKSYL